MMVELVDGRRAQSGEAGVYQRSVGGMRSKMPAEVAERDGAGVAIGRHDAVDHRGERASSIANISPYPLPNEKRRPEAPSISLSTQYPLSAGG